MLNILNSNSEIVEWVVIPLLIIAARICDVTLGTIRIIFVSRGNKLISPLLGFFEVFIWILAISQLMQRLHNIVYYIAYAVGFAAGNFIGIYLEGKLALGLLTVRIITTKYACALKERLSEEGFGVTSIDAEGVTDKVKVIYTTIKRKDLRSVLDIIHNCGSRIFYSIEDTRTANRGVFPHNNNSREAYLGFFKLHNIFGSFLSKK